MDIPPGAPAYLLELVLEELGTDRVTTSRPSNAKRSVSAERWLGVELDDVAVYQQFLPSVMTHQLVMAMIVSITWTYNQQIARASHATIVARRPDQARSLTLQSLGGMRGAVLELEATLRTAHPAPTAVA